MLNHSQRLLTALLLTVCLDLRADATLVFADAGEGNSKAAGTVEISNGRVRASSPGDPSAYMVFDAQAKNFTMIDVDRKTYMIFDQQQIQNLVSMQTRAMEQMEATLANLPAAQREQMRKMMSGMMGGQKNKQKSAPRRYVRNGQTETVAGHNCEVLEVYVGDKKIAEQCVVGQKQLGIPNDDYQTIKAMQEFIVDLVSQFPAVDKNIMQYGEPGKDEIPVRYSRYSKLTGATSGELRSISFSSIDAGRFDIPSGFKQQKMPKL